MYPINPIHTRWNTMVVKLCVLQYSYSMPPINENAQGPSTLRWDKQRSCINCIRQLVSLHMSLQVIHYDEIFQHRRNIDVLQSTKCSGVMRPLHITSGATTTFNANGKMTTAMELINGQKFCIRDCTVLC
jgi:hypothetical protein